MQHVSQHTFADELALAINAAREAGDLLRVRQREFLQVRHKGVVDLVTDADLASERLIAGRLLTAFPSDSLLAEEGTGSDLPQDGGRRWIVDPLDGTTNYAHGYPLYAVSIALEVEGAIEVGVVHVPALGEMFSTARGGGARLNDEPISVSSTEVLIDAMLSTGFAYDPIVRPANQGPWSEFVARTQAVRRDGAAALDLAYVACGRFDGHWERELAPWDQAAGALLVTEAGGTITDYSGDPFSIYRREAVASNGLIHGKMLDVLALNR